MKYHLIAMITSLVVLAGCVSTSQVHPHFSKQKCVAYSNSKTDLGAYGPWLAKGLQPAQGLAEFEQRTMFVSEFRYLKLCQSLVERQDSGLLSNGYNFKTAEKNLIEMTAFLEEIEGALPEANEKLIRFRAQARNEPSNYKAVAMSGYEAARLSLIMRERGVLVLPKEYRDEAVRNFENALEILKRGGAAENGQEVEDLGQAIRALHKI
jgi:hypothetical protein